VHTAGHAEFCAIANFIARSGLKISLENGEKMRSKSISEGGISLGMGVEMAVWISEKAILIIPVFPGCVRVILVRRIGIIRRYKKETHIKSYGSK
jgi:hypothetical protein